MKRSALVLIGLALSFVAMAPAANAKGSLDMYVAKVSAAKASQLLKKGYDISDVRNRGRTVALDMVLTRAQRNRLAARGVKIRLKRTRSGKTLRSVVASQAAGGFNVWRSWDEPGGIRDELFRVARRNRHLVKLEVLGRTYQRRKIIALYQGGVDTEDVAAQLSAGVSGVRRVWQQYREEGRDAPAFANCGRKPTLTDAQREQVRQIVQERPDRFVREIAEEVEGRLGVAACRQTVGRWLRELGFTRKKSRPAPRSSASVRT